MVEAASNGVVNVIITARPRWDHRRVWSDTLHWLQENHIPFDMLLFDKDKHDSLVRHVKPARVLGFVEDRDKHALELASRGTQVYLLDYPHNRTLTTHAHIQRCSGWSDILEAMRASDWGRSSLGG